MLVENLSGKSDFYSATNDTHEEAYRRVMYLKQVIENNDGYRFFI